MHVCMHCAFTAIFFFEIWQSVLSAISRMGLVSSCRLVSREEEEGSQNSRQTEASKYESEKVFVIAAPSHGSYHSVTTKGYQIMLSNLVQLDWLDSRGVLYQGDILKSSHLSKAWSLSKYS